MKKRFFNFLKFIGLVEIQNNYLSLTNLALLLSLTRLLQTTPPTGPEAAILIFTLWACYFNRVFSKRSETRDETPLEASVKKLEITIKELESKVSALSIQSGFKRI